MNWHRVEVRFNGAEDGGASEGPAATSKIINEAVTFVSIIDVISDNLPAVVYSRDSGAGSA